MTRKEAGIGCDGQGALGENWEVLGVRNLGRAQGQQVQSSREDSTNRDRLGPGSSKLEMDGLKIN